ncbi:hypothetical protein ACFLSW_05285 [Candidatus Bipolaricaulota bacterium]
MKRLVTLILISGLMSGLALGQELERISDESTAWWWYDNASVGVIASALDEHNARLIDLEITSVSPLRFSASLVRNSGTYASAWWWYFGIDVDRISELLDELQARIIDLEAYYVGGQLRFAVILVPNTGPQAKAWWWYSGVSAETLSDLVSQHNARLVDLEVLPQSGERRFAAVMISNTGADEADSWWYIGISTKDLADAFSVNSARLLDLERMSDGRYAAILVRPRSVWGWYFGMTASGVEDVVSRHGTRIVDIEPYTSGAATRYLVVLTKNGDGEAAVTGELAREIYPIRIVLSTTSDWTDVRFVGGTIAIQDQDILEGVGADGLQVAAQSTISISQDCCDTVPVRVSFDAYLSDPAEWLQMEVEKGHVGQTTVSLYSPGESDPIDTYMHIGVAEDPDPTNTRTFWIHSPYLTSLLPRVLASPSE